MRTTIFVIKFFLLAAFFIVSNQHLALANQDARQEFVIIYKNWIFNVGEHISSLASYVVRVEWLPDVRGPTNLQDSNLEPILKGSPEENKGPRYSQVKR